MSSENSSMTSAGKSTSDDKPEAVQGSVFDCSWEIDATGSLRAINVPPHVDYASMRNALLRIAGHAGIR